MVWVATELVCIREILVKKNIIKIGTSVAKSDKKSLDQFDGQKK